MNKRSLLLSVVLLTVAVANGQKKDTTIITKVTINEIENDDPKNLPPPPGIDLSRFNIFALKDGRLFYYYDAAFVAKKSFDQLRIENINRSLIRKVDFTQLKTTIQELISSKKLAKDGIITCQDGYDKQQLQRLDDRVFKPLRIDEYSIGHVSKDLYRILDSAH
jgi:hypothetical protein